MSGGTKITNLTDGGNLLPTDELVVNRGGLDRKVTLQHFGEYETTVGASGAEFTTVAAAVTAGKKTITIISDITEPSSVSFPTGNYDIKILHDVTWDLGTSELQPSASTGRWIISGGKITTSYSVVGSHIFDAAGFSGWTADVTRTEIDQTLVTAADCYIAENCTLVLNELTLKPGNVDNSGINVATGFSIILTNLFLQSVGASTSNAIVVASGARSTISNMFISGGFIASGTPAFDFSTTLNIINGMSFFTATTLDLKLAGTVTGIKSLVGGAINVEVTQNGSIFSGLDLLSGIFDLADKQDCVLGDSRVSELDISDVSCNFNKISNVHLTNTSFTFLVAGRENQLANMEFDSMNITGDDNAMTNVNVDGTSLSTVSGDDNVISNSLISGDLTISGDRNGLSNCKFFTSGDLTIDATADQTRIVNCTTDTAITDNGTNTDLANNNVF